MIAILIIIGAMGSSDPTGGLLTELGAVGVLAWVAFAFMSGKLRTEKEINRVIGERDRALDLVYKQAEVAAAALNAAEKKVT